MYKLIKTRVITITHVLISLYITIFNNSVLLIKHYKQWKHTYGV